MALARVVTFDGVNKERMDEMKREMDEGERPDEVPATEVLVLHDRAHGWTPHGSLPTPALVLNGHKYRRVA